MMTILQDKSKRSFWTSAGKFPGHLYKTLTRRSAGKNPDGLLYKYVLHDGNVIGESVAVFDRQLIIKDKDKMLCVADDIIEHTDDEHVYVVDFNYDEALAAGKVWLESNRDTLHFDEKGMLLNE